MEQFQNNCNPLVSISVITYNHEHFIRETLDNILAQKTTFSYEVILGEDCSTDNTRAICIEYKNKFPDIIRLRLPETNMGSMNNWLENLSNCKGKYIALCEGDDYWTDEYKLQKLIDFLESHPDYVMCGHAHKTTFDNKTFQEHYGSKEEYTIEDILSDSWSIMTASIVYRNHSFKFPTWFKTIKNGDMGLQMLLATKGKIHFINEIMSVYRIHPGGISATLKPLSQACWLTYLLFLFNRETNKTYYPLIKERIKLMFKAQIGFAKEYHLRKQALILQFFNSIKNIFPFAIRHLRNTKIQ